MLVLERGQINSQASLKCEELLDVLKLKFNEELICIRQGNFVSLSR